MGVAMISIGPEGVTEEGDRHARDVFLLAEDSSKDGLYAQGGEDAGGKACRRNFFG